MSVKLITIRRYCRVCKHTTKHTFNEVTGQAKCLARKHLGFRSYIYVLRKDGFTKDWETKSKINGRDVQYSKHISSRTLIVQLWVGGGRATHAYKGCSDTTPTDFTTVPGMMRAIHIETTRQDNGWINGSKKFYGESR